MQHKDRYVLKEKQCILHLFKPSHFETSSNMRWNQISLVCSNHLLSPYITSNQCIVLHKFVTHIHRLLLAVKRELMKKNNVELELLDKLKAKEEELVLYFYCVLK